MKPEPLVTLSRSAWRDILRECAAASNKEIFGYLVGRFTRFGARVHHALLQEEASGDNSRIWVADEDSAKMEARIIREYAPLECLGCWHSHVFEEACVSLVLPQLSDRDELTTAIGALECIVSVVPVPDDPDLVAVLGKPNEFHLQRERNGHLCRAEVWLRAGTTKIVPCRMKLR